MGGGGGGWGQGAKKTWQDRSTAVLAEVIEMMNIENNLKPGHEK